MRHLYRGQPYCLNLIDTPGHVDFSYEVLSRSYSILFNSLILACLFPLSPMSNNDCSFHSLASQSSNFVVYHRRFYLFPLWFFKGQFYRTFTPPLNYWCAIIVF